MPPKEIIRKIMIAGDGGVGKSTLLVRLITGKFEFKMRMTIGVDFRNYKTVFHDKPYSLALWDLGGQEHFRTMLPSYCLGAQAAILMYDLTRVITTFHFDDWMKVLHHYIPDLPVILVGSKADLAENLNAYDEDIQKSIEKYKFFDHLKISSKTGDGIDLAFKNILEKIDRF